MLRVRVYEHYLCELFRSKDALHLDYCGTAIRPAATSLRTGSILRSLLYVEQAKKRGKRATEQATESSTSMAVGVLLGGGGGGGCCAQGDVPLDYQVHEQQRHQHQQQQQQRQQQQ